MRRWQFSLRWLAWFYPITTPVGAATNVVTTLADSGPGSLREAIAIAQTNPGPDTITFATNLSGGVIRLTSAQLGITNQSVTITATDLPHRISLDGGHARRILWVDAGASLQLDSLTVSNGFVSNAGGAGILNSGTLFLNNCVVVSNFAFAGYSAGLLNVSTATVVNCTFYRNSAWILGAGIGSVINYVGANTPQLTLMNCTFSANTSSDNGTAVYNDGGLASLRECTIVDNDAGLFVRNGIASIRQSIIASNLFGPHPAADVGASAGRIISEGFNLVGNSNPGIGLTNGINGDQIGTFVLGYLRLGPLQNNGGSTPTILPAADSLAVDAGDPLFNGSGLTDQRGLPRVANCRIDIGAVERQPAYGLLVHTLQSSQLQLNWNTPPCVRLQSATNFLGSWTEVAGSSNGMTVTPSGNAIFYRLAE